MTATPWHVYDRGIGYEVHAGPATEHHWWREGEHGHEKSGECRCIHDGFRATIANKDDAELVVLCVNSHEALASALRQLDDYFDLGPVAFYQSNRIEHASKLVKDTLAGIPS